MKTIAIKEIITKIVSKNFVFSLYATLYLPPNEQAVSPFFGANGTAIDTRFAKFCIKPKFCTPHDEVKASVPLHEVYSLPHVSVYHENQNLGKILSIGFLKKSITFSVVTKIK